MHLKSPTATASDRLRIFTATTVPYHLALCTVPNSPSPTCSQQTACQPLLSRSSREAAMTSLDTLMGGRAT